MTHDKRALTMKALQIALGVVVLIESLIVLFHYQEIATSDHIGLPSQFILLLAGVEVIGAVLFLIPRTIKVGSYVLLAVFLVAVLIHILHGQYNVGGLLVYAAAVIAVRYQFQGGARPIAR